MNYIKVDFTIRPPEPFRDILIASLSEAGFESFMETETGLQAFIPESSFDSSFPDQLELLKGDLAAVSYQVETIAEQNWNAVWESDFHPIEVGDKCRIRAPFHASRDVPYEIIVAPKMSFGTGHHETTWLMMKQMLDLEIAGKSVLDMGTGTGVLAILAAKMGSAEVVAIDNDSHAFENAIENVALNQPVDIAVEKGAADQINGRTFQVILANINKNVLLHDMQTFTDALEKEGELLLSGFFESDVTDLVRKAETCGLRLHRKSEKNHWAVLELQKN